MFVCIPLGLLILSEFRAGFTFVLIVRASVENVDVGIDYVRCCTLHAPWVSHGWPLSSDDWDTQMMFFLSRGYRVIAHDRRGHGRSSQVADGHDVDHYADDLAALTEHGMPTTEAATINEDLWGFLKS